MNFDGKERFDCEKPEGHTMNDDGVCGDPDNADDNCEHYCEIRRTGLVGMETIAPGKFGEYNLPGVVYNLAEGESTTITKGFSIGVEGVAKEVIGAGVSFECKSCYSYSIHVLLRLRRQGGLHILTSAL